MLQKHYRILEALALEHEEAEEISDLTIPDDVRIEKRAGTALRQLKEMVYPEGYDPEAKSTGTKRKVTFIKRSTIMSCSPDSSSCIIHHSEEGKAIEHW